jgi:putative membrane protein
MVEAETSPPAQNANIERAEIHRASDHIRDSAENMEDSAVEIEGSADRSTELAATRTVFAAERTYAAWVRTGLASLASGVGAKALLSHAISAFMVQFAGTVLTLFSAFCFCAAVWRELAPSLSDPVPEARRIPRAILFLVNGSLALVAIASLISIWTTP